MPNYGARFLLAMATVLFVAPCAPGQVDQQTAHAAMDLRLGAFWETISAPSRQTESHFNVGFGFTPYLGHGTVRHRFSLPFAIGYVPISSTTFFEPAFGSDVKLATQLLTLNTSLAFDIVQKPRVALAAHYGGAGVRNYTTFSLETVNGGFQNVCHLRAFAGNCPSEWNYLGNGGVTLRVLPMKYRRWYVGLDYTRFAGSKNQLVGAIGAAF